MTLRILHFIEALAKHIADGLANVSAAQLQERLAACEGCGKRNGFRCSLCGCAILKKAPWRSENCPDNPPRWPVLSDS